MALGTAERQAQEAARPKLTDEERAAQWFESVKSGDAFALRARAQLTLGGNSWLMIPTHHVGYTMRVFTELARAGDDALTLAALRVLQAINPHSSIREFVAKISQTAADIMREGYFDVSRHTGPEGVRASECQRPLSDRETLLLYRAVHATTCYGSGSAIGWCAAIIFEKHGIEHKGYGKEVSAVR